MGTAGSAPPRLLSPAVALACALLGVAAMMGGGVLLATRSHLGLRAQIAVGSALLALPSLLAVGLARPTGRRQNVLALGPVAPSTMALSALLGAVLWVGSIGLMETQSLLMPPPPEYLEAFRAIHRALAPSGPLDALVSLSVIALIPALAEELVMRGVLLPSLVAPLGRAGAVLATALLFAAMHGDRYRFVFTLIIGLVLGAVRLRTGSLWPSIVAHATLNALTFAIAPLVDDPTQAYTPQPVLGLACLAAGAALAVPVLRALRRVDSPGGAP
jgi:membrane protease YdiL (CAAX protease family)